MVATAVQKYHLGHSQVYLWQQKQWQLLYEEKKHWSGHDAEPKYANTYQIRKTERMLCRSIFSMIWQNKKQISHGVHKSVCDIDSISNCRRYRITKWYILMDVSKLLLVSKLFHKLFLGVAVTYYYITNWKDFITEEIISRHTHLQCLPQSEQIALPHHMLQLKPLTQQQRVLWLRFCP